jgi:hypothetical protein
MQIEGWNVIDDEALVLWREYTFAKNAWATTFAFRGTDGIVVVSPAARIEDRALDALREHGTVRALVANNVMHHLGQELWRGKFPDAISYAPGGALDVLKKKSSRVAYRPLGELALPEHVRGEVPPGYKTGEAFFSVRTKKGNVWYAGDLLANMQHLPKPPIGWAFRLSDSAPGFRLFKLAVWVLVKDKKALRSWMLEQVEKEAPKVIVPAHGPAFETGDVAREARTQLERI